MPHHWEWRIFVPLHGNDGAGHQYVRQIFPEAAGILESKTRHSIPGFKCTAAGRDDVYCVATDALPCQVDGVKFRGSRRGLCSSHLEVKQLIRWNEWGAEAYKKFAGFGGENCLGKASRHVNNEAFRAAVRVDRDSGDNLAFILVKKVVWRRWDPEAGVQHEFNLLKLQCVGGPPTFRPMKATTSYQGCKDDCSWFSFCLESNATEVIYREVKRRFFPRDGVLLPAQDNKNADSDGRGKCCNNKETEWTKEELLENHPLIIIGGYPALMSNL
mmetsp:Transcript_682/g.2045  ORF Transcript_682/g.2045 Transcript_682/m.2045 type:complete len:272 (-) Transcript_682:47-862(-)